MNDNDGGLAAVDLSKTTAPIRYLSPQIRASLFRYIAADDGMPSGDWQCVTTGPQGSERLW